MTTADSVYFRLNRQIRDNNLFFRPGDILGKMSMAEIRGKIAFAYEMQLITHEQYEYLMQKAFSTIYGE